MQGRHADLEPLVRRNADRLPAMRRWRCGLALVLAELGREDEARRELEHLAAADFEDVPRDALWLVSMALLAELCALLDDRPRARRLYELLVAYEGRNVVSMGAVYLGPVARYLGLLAMTIGEDERALGHLETARSAAERMGARPMVVLAALDAAEVLARRAAPNDAQRGRALVQRVAQDAAQMGMDARGRARRRPARAPGGGRRARRCGRPGRRPRARRCAASRTCGCWSTTGAASACRTPRACTTSRRSSSTRGRRSPRSRSRPPRAGGRERQAAALVAYRAQAQDLREELAEAQAFNDPERILARARAASSCIAADVEQRRRRDERRR